MLIIFTKRHWKNIKTWILLNSSKHVIDTVLMNYLGNEPSGNLYYNFSNNELERK